MNVIKGVLDDEIGDFFLAELLDEFRADFLLNGLDGGFAGEFAGREQRGHKTVAGEFLGLLQNFVGHDVERDFAFLPAGLGDQFLLRGNDRLAGFLAELQRGVEVGLGDFLRRAFIHHDVICVADINEVEIALLHLGMRRVGDEFAFDAAHADRAERPGPRNVADHQRGARADDAENVRVVLAVGAQHDGLHLDFVVPALGKERADRPVGQAAGEDFLFRRTAFAFEVAAGEFARRRRLFAVIHGQREKFLAFLGLGRGDGGDDDDGFAELDGYGAVRLFGEFSGFNDDLFVAHLGGDFFWHNILSRRRRRNFSELRTLSELNEITQGRRIFHTRCVWLRNRAVRVCRPKSDGGRRPAAKQQPRLRKNSMAQFQFLRDRLITAQVRVLQIFQQAPALADHHQQPATRTVVFFVGLQMLGQMVDPLREQGNLHVRRPRVASCNLNGSIVFVFASIFD